MPQQTGESRLPLRGHHHQVNTEAGLGPMLGKNHMVFNLDEGLRQLDQLYEELLEADESMK